MNEEQLKKIKEITEKYNSQNLTKGSERYFKMQIGRSKVFVSKYQEQRDEITSELGLVNKKIEKLEEDRNNTELTPDEIKAKDEELKKAKEEQKKCINSLKKIKEKLEATAEKLSQLENDYTEMENSIGEAIENLRENKVFDTYIREEYAKSYDRKMKEVEDRKAARENNKNTLEKIEFWTKKNDDFSKDMQLAIQQGAKLRSLKIEKIELEENLKDIDDVNSPEYKETSEKIEKLNKILHANEENTKVAYNGAYESFSEVQPKEGEVGHVSKKEFYKVVGDMAENTNPRKKHVKIEKIANETRDSYEEQDKEDDEKLNKLGKEYKEQGIILEPEEVESEMAENVRQNMIKERTEEVEHQISELIEQQRKAEMVDASKIVKQVEKKRAKLEKLRNKIRAKSERGVLDGEAMVPYEKMSFFEKLKHKIITEPRTNKVKKLAREINSLNQEYEEIYSEEARAEMKAKIDGLQAEKEGLGKKSITDEFRKNLSVKGINEQDIVDIVRKSTQRQINNQNKDVPALGE